MRRAREKKKPPRPPMFFSEWNIIKIIIVFFFFLLSSRVSPKVHSSPSAKSVCFPLARNNTLSDPMENKKKNKKKIRNPTARLFGYHFLGPLSGSGDPRQSTGLDENRTKSSRLYGFRNRSIDPGRRRTRGEGAEGEGKGGTIAPPPFGSF